MPVSVKNNDPKGNEYFFLKGDKLYIRIHVDRKTTIDRIAREKDKENYPKAWKEFSKRQELSELSFKNEPTQHMPGRSGRHRDK